MHNNVAHVISCGKVYEDVFICANESCLAVCYPNLNKHIVLSFLASQLGGIETARFEQTLDLTVSKRIGFGCVYLFLCLCW